MSRPKRKAAGIPEWMVTFGDMMSLLLCFFIMLFAMSVITPKRFQALADTLSQDFTGYAGSSTQKAKGRSTTTTVSASGAKSKRISALIGGQPTPGPVGEETEVHVFQLDGETIKVICFELGSDEPTDQAKWDLRAILPRLKGSPQKIMVRGYALPSEGGEAFQGATDLAFSRAISAMDYLVSLGLRPNFFEIATAPGTAPERNLLPAGTDPSLAGASVEIILLHQVQR